MLASNKKHLQRYLFLVLVTGAFIIAAAKISSRDNNVQREAKVLSLPPGSAKIPDPSPPKNLFNRTSSAELEAKEIKSKVGSSVTEKTNTLFPEEKKGPLLKPTEQENKIMPKPTRLRITQIEDSKVIEQLLEKTPEKEFHRKKDETFKTAKTAGTLLKKDRERACTQAAINNTPPPSYCTCEPGEFGQIECSLSHVELGEF